MSLIIKSSKALTTAVALVLIWYVAMAGLFRLSEQAPGALVFFPDHYLSAQALPQGVSILKWNSFFAVLASENAGYIDALYSAGFPVVFPARSGGCFSYRALR